MYKDNQCRLRGSQVHHQCQAVCQIRGGPQWPGGTYWHRRRHESWVGIIFMFLQVPGDRSFLIWSISLTGQQLSVHGFAVVEIVTLMSFCWKTVTHLHAVLESSDFVVILMRTVCHGPKPFILGLIRPSFQVACVVCFLFGSLCSYTQGSYRKGSPRR